MNVHVDTLVPLAITAANTVAQLARAHVRTVVGLLAEPITVLPARC
jgi:hypothetical protein